MKEFRSKTGGRYIFNEDILNLQELALSSIEMFKDSGLDFVISGCAISITQRTSGGVNYYDISVGAGYAFINNHIEKVAAFTATVNSIQRIGIYETFESGPDIMYADGSTDAQYNEYKGTIKANDSNSGNAACIVATGNGTSFKFPNLRSAYFNKYVLTNNGVVDHYDSSPVFSGSVSTNELILTGLTHDSRYPSVSIVSAELYLDKNSPFVNNGIDEDTLIQGIALDGGAGGANIYSCAGQILIDRLLINELTVSDENLRINDKSLTNHLKQFFVHKDGGTLNVGATLRFESEIEDDTQYSTTIGPSQIIIKGFDGTDITKLTGGGIETKTIEADSIKYTGERSSISLNDIQNFFDELNDNKAINIISPNNTYGNHGGIYIDASAINGQYITIENSKDDDGDYDYTRISPTGITIHHGEDPSVILTYDGIYGDIHAETIWERYNGNGVRSIAVSDIIDFFTDNTGNTTSRTMSIQEVDELFELDATALREYTKTGAPLCFRLTDVYSNSIRQIGYVSIFTDNLCHQLTVEITSNFQPSGNQKLRSAGHVDGTVYTFRRIYGFNAPHNLVNGAWTDWEEAYPKSLGDLVTSISQILNSGYNGTLTIDGKTLTFTNGILTNVQ